MHTRNQAPAGFCCLLYDTAVIRFVGTGQNTEQNSQTRGNEPTAPVTIRIVELHYELLCTQHIAILGGGNTGKQTHVRKPGNGASFGQIKIRRPFLPPLLCNAAAAVQCPLIRGYHTNFTMAGSKFPGATARLLLLGSSRTLSIVSVAVASLER